LYAKKPLSVEAEQLVFWMLTKKPKKEFFFMNLNIIRGSQKNGSKKFSPKIKKISCLFRSIP
jgi:hypothetical protein